MFCHKVGTKGKEGKFRNHIREDHFPLIYNLHCQTPKKKTVFITAKQSLTEWGETQSSYFLRNEITS